MKQTQLCKCWKRKKRGYLEEMVRATTPEKVLKIDEKLKQLNDQMKEIGKAKKI